MFGRKRVNLVATIPFLIATIMLACSQSLEVCMYTDYVTTMFLGKIDAANQLPVVKVKLKSKFIIHFKSGSRNSKMLNVCEV